MMKWFVSGFLLTSVFAVVLLGALYYWDSHQMNPSATHVAAVLLGIPLALFFTYWLSKKLWTVRKEKKQKAAEAEAEAKEAEKANADSEPAPTINTTSVIAAAIKTMHGDSAEALREIAKSGEVDFELDAQLVNAEGFPVLTGRIDDVDMDAQRDALRDWLSKQDKTDLYLSDEQVRTIDLGSFVINALMEQVLMHPTFEQYQIAKPAEKPRIQLPMLGLTPMLPLDWPDETYAAIGAWFTFLVTEAGWPQDRVALKLYKQDTLSRWGEVLTQLVNAEATTQPPLNLLVSCSSYIGEASIEQWPVASQQLFGGGKNTTHIPGEGAAGLLIADDMNAALFEGLTKSRLYAPQKIEGNGTDKSQSDASIALAQGLLKGANIAADNITLLVTDSDQSANRIIETANVARTALPHLEADEQVVQVSYYCGSLGATAFLISTALAHDEVEAENGISLTLSNLDNDYRFAAIQTPWDLPAEQNEDQQNTENE